MGTWDVWFDVKQAPTGAPGLAKWCRPAIYFGSMRLPNGDRAIVDIQKLTDYCLNSSSPRGRHKARVFAAALGLGPSDAAVLRAGLLEAARNGDAVEGEVDMFGKRYTIDFTMRTNVGEAIVRSGWIVLHGNDVPRMTTCFVRAPRHE